MNKQDYSVNKVYLDVLHLKLYSVIHNIFDLIQVLFDNFPNHCMNKQDYLTI